MIERAEGVTLYTTGGRRQSHSGEEDSGTCPEVSVHVVELTLHDSKNSPKYLWCVRRES